MPYGRETPRLLDSSHRSGRLPLQTSRLPWNHLFLSFQSKITVTVRNGHVTLSGTLQYDTQRRSLLNAARGAVGVRNVVDQLQTKPKEKNWGSRGSQPITAFG